MKTSTRTESGLQESVIKWLKTLDCCWFVKIPGSPYLRGIPDLIGCYQGRFFALELKTPGRLKYGVLVPKNDSERHQGIVILAIQKAMGIAGFFDSLEECKKALLEVQ